LFASGYKKIDVDVATQWGRSFSNFKGERSRLILKKKEKKGQGIVVYGSYLEVESKGRRVLFTIVI
jgi:hypothetical protein